MKKLRLRKGVKYVLFGIFNIIVFMVLPNILKTPNDINTYRANIGILTILLAIDFISLINIESK